jgi:sn-glycerol 3-phosphate transport system ATP-binding protein
MDKRFVFKSWWLPILVALPQIARRPEQCVVVQPGTGASAKVDFIEVLGSWPCRSRLDRWAAFSAVINEQMNVRPGDRISLELPLSHRDSGRRIEVVPVPRSTENPAGTPALATLV